MRDLNVKINDKELYISDRPLDDLEDLFYIVGKSCEAASDYGMTEITFNINKDVLDMLAEQWKDVKRICVYY